MLKVGFAAETEALPDRAREKLERKNLDFIVGNDVMEEGSGFGTDTNRVIIIARGGATEQLPLLSKQEVAAHILDRLTPLLDKARS